MKKRLIIFLAFAFGISWLTALLIHQTGGLIDSPEIITNSGITLAIVLLATIYMWAPALAHVFTRLLTREGWQDLNLKPCIKTAWPYWILAWFGPGILTLLGAALFFLVFPQNFDPDLGLLNEQLRSAGTSQGPINPITYIILQTAFAMIITPVANGMASFGEEFGWRAYLLPKLLPMGKRKALIISSLIWGIWHWPVVLMGHNYGLAYSGYPWLGLLATLWFTLSVGILFGWLSLQAGSVWPAVIAHGALNGIANIGSLFVKGSFSTLLGPSPAGVISGLFFTMAAIWILVKQH